MSRALGLPVAVLVLAAVVALFWAVTQPMQAAIGERQARLVALAEEEAALVQRVAEFGAGLSVPDLPEETLLPGATTAEAGLALQARLADLAEAGGVLITAMQEGAGPEGVAHPTVAVMVEGEGGYAEVAALLAALEGQVPPLGLRELVMRPVVEGQQRVTLRLVVWGFLSGGAG